MPIKNWLIIAASFLAALLLTIVPLPSALAWLRPLWAPMVFMYWAMALPGQISLGTAWCLGILLDGLTGTLLGQHALAFVATAYLIIRFCRQIWVFPLWQQAMALFVLLSVYAGLLLMVQGFIGQLGVSAWGVILSLLISALLWPGLYLLLHKIKQRYMI